MTPEKIKSLPLSPDFGYKVKNGDSHRCFFRYDRKQVAWLEVVTGQKYRDEAAVKAILLHEIKFGSFVIFQCCCFDCFTPEAKAIGRDYMKRTGEPISNGYWPECAPKMMRHYDENIKAEPPPVSGGEAQGKLSNEN